MSKRGAGFFAPRTQRTDAKKVLGSVYEMNTGGSVVALDGDKGCMQK